MSNPKLSVIIPAYNAAEDLKRGILDDVAKYLAKQGYPSEVLIVNDGSSDQTAEIVKKNIADKKSFRLIDNPHKGKAVTVMTGLLESCGEIAVFTDVDQSTPLPEIEKFFPKFEQGFDIVIGSRSGRSGSPFIRKIATLGFSILRTVILGLNISDTQCGFKAFDRKAIEQIFPPLLKKYQEVNVSGRALNADFDAGFLFLAGKKGLKIAEVKVDWHDENPESANLVKNAIDTIKGMIRIRVSDFRGEYA